jgi:hypothetical protein
MQVSARKRSWISFGIIFAVSTAIAFALIGRQVFSANWGLVDDHDTFSFIGTGQRMPITDFLHVLLTKTEVGNVSNGRFRPSYYFFMLLESAVWGKNVHLWYLARTVFFAVFIASLWWLLGKFVRIWLAAALLLPILFLPFWGGVWARLGPSEIYGTLALGLTLFGIYTLVESPDENKRKWAAALVTFAAFLLIGSKETFIPLSGAALVALVFAGFTRRIPPWMTACFSFAICLYAAAIIFVVQRSVSATGEDFYANTIDLRQLLGIAARALYTAVFGSGLVPCYAIVILLFGYYAKRANRNLRDWARSSCIIVAIFIFMAGIYFSQQVVYRGQLPLQMRYDFPASLFVPFSYYALICYVFYQMRFYVHSRLTTYISIFLTIAIFAAYSARLSLRFSSTPIARAVSDNIQKTGIFFGEISALAASAKEKPQSPIILEVYGAEAYEALTGLNSYLRSFGAENPISVRLHTTEKSKGALYDRLEREMQVMEREGNSLFVPLARSLANPQNGCISVGINEAGSSDCVAFSVRS